MSYSASQWAGLDIGITGMTNTWNAWINEHAIMEIKDHDSFQENLFWTLKALYRDQGDVCFECCRQPSEVHMCCPQANCMVIFIDACMFKTVKRRGGMYKTLEQKVVESVMRQHALIGLHALDKKGAEAQRIGPYHNDYKHFLTRIALEEFASLKTRSMCDMLKEIRLSVGDSEVPNADHAETQETSDA